MSRRFCASLWGDEAAERPVCLVIDAGKARLVPADYLWGKDTYETGRPLPETLSDLGLDIEV